MTLKETKLAKLLFVASLAFGLSVSCAKDYTYSLNNEKEAEDFSSLTSINEGESVKVIANTKDGDIYSSSSSNLIIEGELLFSFTGNDCIYIFENLSLNEGSKLEITARDELFYEMGQLPTKHLIVGSLDKYAGQIKVGNGSILSIGDISGSINIPVKSSFPNRAYVVIDADTDIESTAKLIVGTDAKQATLSLSEMGTLILREGVSIKFATGTQIKIDNGAELVIESEGLKLENFDIEKALNLTKEDIKANVSELINLKLRSAEETGTLKFVNGRLEVATKPYEFKGPLAGLLKASIASGNAPKLIKDAVTFDGDNAPHALESVVSMGLAQAQRAELNSWANRFTGGIDSFVTYFRRENDRYESLTKEEKEKTDKKYPIAVEAWASKGKSDISILGADSSERDSKGVALGSAFIFDEYTLGVYANYVESQTKLSMLEPVDSSGEGAGVGLYVSREFDDARTILSLYYAQNKDESSFATLGRLLSTERKDKLVDVGLAYEYQLSDSLRMKFGANYQKYETEQQNVIDGPQNPMTLSVGNSDSVLFSVSSRYSGQFVFGEIEANARLGKTLETAKVEISGCDDSKSINYDSLDRAEIGATLGARANIYGFEVKGTLKGSLGDKTRKAQVLAQAIIPF